MINLQTDAILSLAEATKALPAIGGKRPHVSTLWRWCMRGVRGVRLDHAKLGGRTVTSLEALQRFAEQLAARDLEAFHGGEVPQPEKRPRSASRRERDIDAAEQELQAAGI